jgi:hypothetical protein
VRRQDGGPSASSEPDDAPPHRGPDDGLSTSRFNALFAGHEPAADARDVEELLANLSLLRLALSAELSAAAGALDDQRPEVAADIIGGARIDLAKLRVSVARRQARRTVPALVGGAPEHATHGRPRRKVALGNWQGRILAGALAVGLALMALPHSRGGGDATVSGSASAGSAQAQSIDVKLVSSEFSTLRETLQSKAPAAASILAAGANWHTAVARTLPSASTHAATATQIVALLREERALLATPAMGTPAMRQAASELQSSADGLFSQLRSLATTQVLAVLPDVITALPLPTTTPSAPLPSQTPAPTTAPTPEPTATTSPDQGTPVTPVTPAPPTTAPSVPSPVTVPTLPALPIPLPSLPTLPALPSLPSLIQNLGGLLGPQETTNTTGSSHASISSPASNTGASPAPSATPTP